MLFSAASAWVHAVRRLVYLSMHPMFLKCVVPIYTQAYIKNGGVDKEDFTRINQGALSERLH